MASRSTEGESVAGAQSLQRAAAILRTVAEAPERGWHARDVAERAGLNVSTADRMMRALCQERLLERDPDRLYRLGPDMLIFAALKAGSVSIVDHYRPVLEQVAALTSDTVFLWARSGDDAICMARIEGSFPIRLLPAEIGNRRPLGMGAGALSILAALADGEVAQILARNAPRYAMVGLTPERVRELIGRTRETGFGFNDGWTVPEMSAVAVEAPDPASRLTAAIGIAAITSRLVPPREREIAALIAAKIAENNRG